MDTMAIRGSARFKGAREEAVNIDMENGGQRRICIFTSSNQNLEHPLPIHCLTPVEYVISFHFPHPHFEMSAGLRPYEAGRILSFSKQMLRGPLYVLVNDIYTVIVLLQHKV